MSQNEFRSQIPGVGGEAEDDGEAFSVRVSQGRGGPPGPPELALQRQEGPLTPPQVSPFEKAPILML